MHSPSLYRRRAGPAAFECHCCRIEAEKQGLLAQTLQVQIDEERKEEGRKSKEFEGAQHSFKLFHLTAQRQWAETREIDPQPNARTTRLALPYPFFRSTNYFLEGGSLLAVFKAKTINRHHLRESANVTPARSENTHFVLPSVVQKPAKQSSVPRFDTKIVGSFADDSSLP